MILKTLLEKTLIPFLSISFSRFSIGLKKEFPLVQRGVKSASLAFRVARNLVAQDGKGETLDLSKAKNFGFFCAKKWLLFHASLLFHVRKIYFTVGKSLAFFQFDHHHFHSAVVGYYQSQINESIVSRRKDFWRKYR